MGGAREGPLPLGPASRSPQTPHWGASLMGEPPLGPRLPPDPSPADRAQKSPKGTGQLEASKWLVPGTQCGLDRPDTVGPGLGLGNGVPKENEQRSAGAYRSISHPWVRGLGEGGGVQRVA